MLLYTTHGLTAAGFLHRYSRHRAENAAALTHVYWMKAGISISSSRIIAQLICSMAWMRSLCYRCASWLRYSTALIFWAILHTNTARLEQAAARFLSLQELARLEGLRFPKRRGEWLLGRWTAKNLAHQCIPELQGLSLAAFSVLSDSQGAPYLATLEGTPLPFPLSISHREQYAFCALSLRAGQHLGVDIERIEQRSTGFLEDYFTVNEQRYASQLPDEAQPAWVTVAWSLKESLLKAIGIGLRVDTRRLEVNCSYEPSYTPSGDLQDWMPAAVRKENQGIDPFKACWCRFEDYVLTLVYRREESDLGQDSSQLQEMKIDPPLA
jgi:4'-phosphopantetheinyl transferase